MAFVCASCRSSLRRVLSRQRCGTAQPRSASSSQSYSSKATTAPRVGIIGSGPAGFYAAHRLQQRLPDSKIDMYEMLPTPYGLVRYGVAPDHPEVKNCIDTFSKVAEHPNFRFVGNVAIGEGPASLSLKSLTEHYDALLFSYGASKDKRLGIPGEDLHGVLSARAFVGWYNGLPEYADLKPDFSDAEKVVIIGQGNVSMDVARMILSPVNKLREMPDVTENAVEVLSRSRIREVAIVGRRGPLQAAFTTKELRELTTLEGTNYLPPRFSPLLEEYLPSSLKALPRQLKRSAEVMIKYSDTTMPSSNPVWSLEYLLSPAEVVGDNNRLTGVNFRRMRMRQPLGDIDNKDVNALRSMQVESCPDQPVVPIDAQLAFRSVGYKSEPLQGMDEAGITFDNKLGIIPNDVYGRIINPSAGPGFLTAGHVPGMYAAGWVKRGPTGVIATTMEDAFTSADVLISDWTNRAMFLNGPPETSTSQGWQSLQEGAKRKGIRPIDWEDWKKIDAEELRRGKANGKIREKFRDVHDMLKVLD